MAAPVYQGVFNVTQGFSGIPGLYADGTHPTDNTTYLNEMIAALLSSTGPTLGQGGTLEFPSAGTYAFDGTITIGKDNSNTTQPYAIILRGDGQGAGSAPTLQQTVAGDLFQINNLTTSDSNVGGVTFMDLQIQYTSAATSGAGIHVGPQLEGQNVRLFRVVLQDVPQGVWFEESLQCSMVDCTAFYSAQTGTALTIGNPTSDNAGLETYIAGCVFRTSTNSGTGVVIHNAEHFRMTNSRIEGFEQGILIQPGGSDHNIRKVYFGNVSCYPSSTSSTTGAAVMIQPTDGQWVAQVTFAECDLDAPDSGTLYTGGGVVLDPINGASGGGIIDQIRFVDCHVCKWPGPGLLILGGSSAAAAASNIEVVGGYYSLNGSNPASGLPSAGIAMIGGSAGPSGVRITGAAANNSLYDVISSGGSGFLTAVQKYGISIETAQHVFVRACDLRGNLTQAVTAGGTITDLQITESPAYNDQAVTVKSGAPANGLIFNPSTYGYYGPAAFYVSGGTVSSISINGTSTGLMSGAFTLSPGESAVLFYSAAPSFYMVGK